MRGDRSALASPRTKDEKKKAKKSSKHKKKKHRKQQKHKRHKGSNSSSSGDDDDDNSGSSGSDGEKDDRTAARKEEGETTKKAALDRDEWMAMVQNPAFLIFLCLHMQSFLLTELLLVVAPDGCLLAVHVRCCVSASGKDC